MPSGAISGAVVVLPVIASAGGGATAGGHWLRNIWPDLSQASRWPQGWLQSAKRVGPRRVNSTCSRAGAGDVGYVSSPGRVRGY